MTTPTTNPTSLDGIDPGGKYAPVDSLSSSTGFRWAPITQVSTEAVIGSTDSAQLTAIESDINALQSSALSLAARATNLEANQLIDVEANVTLIRKPTIAMPAAGTIPTEVSALNSADYDNGEIVKVENLDGNVFYGSNGTAWSETDRRAEGASTIDQSALNRTGSPYTFLETDKNRRILVDNDVTINQVSAGCLLSALDLINVSSSGINVIGGSGVALSGDVYMSAGSGLTLTILDTGASTNLQGIGG